MSTTSQPHIMAASALAVLALLATSCGTPTNMPVPAGNPASAGAVPAQGPGAQPTAPEGGVAGPVLGSLPGPAEAPIRTPGAQPVDPGPVVVAPEMPMLPTVIPSDSELTPTVEPSQQLPIPDLP